MARRLRALRLEEWPGVTVTQPQLAAALGVSPPLISAWENEDKPTLVPSSRLVAVARFFATPRSLNGKRSRLLDDRDMTAEERLRRDQLQAELMTLHDAAKLQGPAPVPAAGSSGMPLGGPLRFPTDQDITIVCAPLPSEMRERMPYHDPDEPDYVESWVYADPDALIELHGHVRATNPLSQVRIRRASNLRRDDLTTHLLLIGGVDWNALTRDLLDVLPVPVSQTPREDDEATDEGGFWVGEGPGRRVVNPVVDVRGDRRTLRQDVAHLFRGPNPFNRKRTVTMFNGAFGRGTYGAVRILTDARFRDRNADYLTQRFTGDTYSILARVRIVMREVVTPDLTVEDTRLHEWPDA
jgi:transcriptional regulator with XRE-family HTH domain